MAFPKLYTDEDIDPHLAHILTEKGFDAIACHQSNMRGKSDEAQLKFATQNNRVIMTHNIRDFCLLAKLWGENSLTHQGIILAPQIPFAQLLHSTIRTLGTHAGVSFANHIIWLKT